MSEITVSTEHLLDCTCSACSAGTDDASMDPQAGGTANGKLIWTADQAANYLNRTGGGYANTNRDLATDGRQNNIGDNNSVITFGFFNTYAEVYRNGYTYTANNAQGVPTLYGLAEAFNFAPFTEAQRAAAREAYQYWDDLVAVSFKEVSADDADMNLANLASAPGTQAYARIPTAGLDATLGGQVREIGGDSWYSASAASNFQLDEGLYGMNTLVHEIGHGLGLSHPGAYNFGPGFAVTYANGAEYAQDLRNYTIMSYWNPRDVGIQDHDYHLGTIAYGATPMVHDILAIQKIYGADMTTRTGDTTYGFNATADTNGRDALNFDLTPAPVMAIWDAGGIDTLDASKYATNQIIDLTPGSLSSIGGVTLANAPTLAQVNANRAAAGYAPLSQASYDIRMNNLRNDPNAGRLVDNVGIAYGATIENAKGGSGNDAIGGNSADNVLTGNAGNDALTGREGNDTLDGGTGDDIMLGGTGNDVYIVGEAGDIVTELASEGTDVVFASISYTLVDHVENLVLTGPATTGTGNGLDNVLTGNELANLLNGGAGNDTLDGGAGNDTLNGNEGNDTLNGGNGRDALDGGAGDDRLVGGDGVDVLKGGDGNDVFVAEINTDKVASKNGLVSLDQILDFKAGDKIDLSGIDAKVGDAGHQKFNFVNNASGNKAGDLFVKTFGNLNAAEKSLGLDLDQNGTIGGDNAGGKLSVVFGNTDGGDPEFAIVLYGVDNITPADFIFV